MVKFLNKFIMVFFFIFILINNLFSIGAESTFKLKKINNEYVPFQGDIPYAQFEYDDKDVIILNGKWKTQRIKLNHKLSLKKRDKAVIKALEKESRGRYKTSYNDKKWKKKTIPHVNNPFPDRYQDGMWYRKEAIIPKEYKNKNLRIFFQGANYTTDVWINGKYAGFHEGGYTPFAFDITKYVKFGKKNIISVRVDNIPWLIDNEQDEITNEHDIVPYKTMDWWNYGGINRDVYIKASEMTHIVRVNIKTEVIKKNSARLKVGIVLNNTDKKEKKVKVKIKVYEAEITEKNILNPGAENIINYKKISIIDKPEAVIDLNSKSVDILFINSVLSNIKTWSPGKPNLYVMNIILQYNSKVLENYYTQFGIRDVKIDKKNTSIKLNNKEIFLKGIARHEDHPETGRALRYKDIKKVYNDLKIIKDANANFIRTAHYPNHPMTYILADRMGLCVMEEIPVMWFDGAEFDLQRKERGIAKCMWLEMIYRDYNRPSILFWSACNEGGDQKQRGEYIADVYKIAYKIDGSRLVGQSAFGSDTRDKTHHKCDFIGITSYSGVFYNNSCYYDTKKDLAKYNNFIPEKPIIATEIGIWSEIEWGNVERQKEVARDTVKAFKESKYGWGVCWWCAFDWFTMQNVPYQTMGLVTDDRKLFKPVYFELQRSYGEIPPGSLVIKSPLQNDIVKGKVVLKININPKFKLKVKAYKIDNESYKSIKNNTVNIDTLKYDDGEKIITVRAENDKGKAAAAQVKVYFDNYDDSPEVKIMNPSKFAVNTYDLRIIAKDDREGLQVFYRLDKGQKKQLLLLNKKKNLYRKLIDVSSFKDSSSHNIKIFLIDKGRNIVNKELKFQIKRKKQTFVQLPFNLDRISYNNNRKDAFEWSFPGEELPKGKNFEYSADDSGVQFFLGNKEDKMNNILVCKGQNLKGLEGKYGKIHVFGYSYWGNQKNECILEYKDGSINKEILLLSEWNNAIPGFNNRIAWYCSQHHEHTGGEGNPDIAFYHTVLKCDKSKTLTNIVLPDDNHKHIIGITLE